MVALELQLQNASIGANGVKRRRRVVSDSDDEDEEVVLRRRPRRDLAPDSDDEFNQERAELAFGPEDFEDGEDDDEDDEDDEDDDENGDVTYFSINDIRGDRVRERKRMLARPRGYKAKEQLFADTKNLIVKMEGLEALIEGLKATVDRLLDKYGSNANNGTTNRVATQTFPDDPGYMEIKRQSETASKNMVQDLNYYRRLLRTRLGWLSEELLGSKEKRAMINAIETVAEFKHFYTALFKMFVRDKERAADEGWREAWEENKKALKAYRSRR
jgi:hypothetical protein